MAAGPKDTGPTLDSSQDAPTRPQTMPRSVIWPDAANLPAQQSAANQTFRQNSEHLQKSAQARRETQLEQAPAPGPRELSFAKDHARGNYADLKQEHANAILKEEHVNAIGRDTPDGQEHQQDHEHAHEQDHERERELEQEQEQEQEHNKSASDHDLRFVKDGARDNNAEPQQAQAGTSGKGKDLTFVKDQSQDLNRGR